MPPDPLVLHAYIHIYIHIRHHVTPLLKILATGLIYIWVFDFHRLISIPSVAGMGKSYTISPPATFVDVNVFTVQQLITYFTYHEMNAPLHYHLFFHSHCYHHLHQTGMKIM